MSTLTAKLEELVKSLNDKKASAVLDVVDIQSYEPDDLLCVLDKDLLDPCGKEALAQILPTGLRYLPVLKRIIMQSGLCMSLAKEILRTDRWEEMMSFLQKYKVAEAEERDQKTHNLGSMLGDYAALFWAMKILFSASAIKGLKASVWDREASARLAAIQALDSHDISATEVLYIRGLDDSNKEVRDAALLALKKKIPFERLSSLLEGQRNEAKFLLTSIQSIKESLMGGLSGIGEKAIGVGRDAVSKGGEVASSISAQAVAAQSAVNSIWGKLVKKKDKEQKEPPDAVFALCIAMSWADGKIELNEKEALASLLKNDRLDKKFAYWLIDKPKLDELTPYLKKIKDPERAFGEIVELLNLELSSEEAIAWIQAVKTKIGIK